MRVFEAEFKKLKRKTITSLGLIIVSLLVLVLVLVISPNDNMMIKGKSQKATQKDKTEKDLQPQTNPQLEKESSKDKDSQHDFNFKFKNQRAKNNKQKPFKDTPINFDEELAYLEKNMNNDKLKKEEDLVKVVGTSNWQKTGKIKLQDEMGDIVEADIDDQRVVKVMENEITSDLENLFEEQIQSDNLERSPDSVEVKSVTIFNRHK